MKRSIARKWAAALASGEYKQTTGKLREGDTFCCLGVLCNLHAQEHPEIAAEEKHKGLYLGADVELPALVQEWAGMASSSGRFDGTRCLIDLNDDEDKTFPEIAKVIRKEWKKL